MKTMTNLKDSKSLFVILALGVVLVVAAVSIVLPGELAIAQSGSENSTDSSETEKDYKHGDGKDCPFKDKRNSNSSVSKENS